MNLVLYLCDTMCEEEEESRMCIEGSQSGHLGAVKADGDGEI